MLSWKKVLGRIALGSIAFLAVAGLGLAAWNRSWEKRWERRVEELRVLAEPARQRCVRSPETAELGSRLLEIAARVDELLPSDDEVASWGQPAQRMDVAHLESARKALDRVAEPLKDWRDLWEDERLQVAIARGERLTEPCNSLRLTRRFVNALCWQARLESLDPAARGDATSTLASGLDLARAYDGGTMIDAFIRMALQETVLRWAKAENGLLHVDSVALRAALDGRLQNIERTPCPAGVLENEIALFLDRYTGIGGWVTAPFTGVIERGPLMYRTALAAFGDVEELRTWGELSPRQLLARPTLDSDSSGSVYRSPFSHMIELWARSASVAAQARIALALEAHRGEHGTLPASLDELAPAFSGGVPLDPLTDKPFAYEREGDRARLGPSAWVQREPLAWESACERLLAWEL
jgi:hypothetical protein